MGMGKIVASISRVVRPVAFGATVMMSLALAGQPAFAFAPRLPELARTSRILLVRDICSVRRHGNTETTSYCDGGYVCDRQNPGMCKPGPELQRQLDEERRQEEERLAQAQRELDAQLRQLRARQRALGSVFRGPNGPVDTSRAGNCSTISSRDYSGGGPAGCQQPRRLSENVYDLSRGSAPRYRPAVRQAPQRQPLKPLIERQINTSNFANVAGYLLSAMAALQPKDPARLDMERQLENVTRQYGQRGVDTKSALEKIQNRLPNAPQPAAATEPAADDEPPTDGATPAGAAAPQVAQEPAKPVIPAKDEALCSYLMTFEEGDANRLGVAVPDYCEPYLRSLGREPKDPDAPDPRRVVFALEDEYQIMMMKREYYEMFAPDLGE
jgi:hypothetical protein